MKKPMRRTVWYVEIYKPYVDAGPRRRWTYHRDPVEVHKVRASTRVVALSLFADIDRSRLKLGGVFNRKEMLTRDRKWVERLAGGVVRDAEKELGL